MIALHYWCIAIVWILKNKLQHSMRNVASIAKIRHHKSIFGELTKCSEMPARCAIYSGLTKIRYINKQSRLYPVSEALWCHLPGKVISVLACVFRLQSYEASLQVILTGEITWTAQLRQDTDQTGTKCLTHHTVCISCIFISVVYKQQTPHSSYEKLSYGVLFVYQGGALPQHPVYSIPLQLWGSWTWFLQITKKIWKI